MRCGYMILTFMLGLAVASPAVYAVALLIIGVPTEVPRLIFAGVGAIELFLAIVIGAVSVEAWVPPLLRGAKAELDALMAGMRGEG